MTTKALDLWKKFETKPGGKWIFSRLVSMKAPYFGSIRPLFVDLRPGYSEVSIRKRRSVLNHIGTVHAIAMCNMAELAAGTMTDVSIPSTHRWIPKGMTVQYLEKAQTDLRAIATSSSEINPNEAVDYIVNVKVLDKNDLQVFSADINMWVTPKKRDLNKELL